MDRVPVLLDTDIGSDIDDAVALAYLLRQPRCELLGITTVTGDVQKRAALAEVICRSIGREDIPIHCGRREVLVAGPGQPEVPQYDAIRSRPHRMDRPEDTAVEFLRETIRSRPGEITLLTIGPYGNIGLLFAMDPEIPSLLKDIVSMGGVFFTPDRREWNAMCDPAGAQMAYAARRPRHLTVGLDVTERCRMLAGEVRSRFTGEPLETVVTMAERWFTHSPHITFHDPLAAALIFRPEIAQYRVGQVTVASETVGDTAGSTYWTEGAGTERVATEVDSDAFFREYFDVVSGGLGTA